jgi:hypothetical protein
MARAGAPFIARCGENVCRKGCTLADVMAESAHVIIGERALNGIGVREIAAAYAVTNE